MDKKTIAAAAAAFLAGMGAMFAAQKIVDAAAPGAEESEPEAPAAQAAAPREREQPAAAPAPRREAQARRRARRPQRQDGEEAAGAAEPGRESPRRDGGRRERRGMRGRGMMSGSLDELKKNDPETYAQVTNHMARVSRHMGENAARRMKFLADIEPSEFSPEALAVHNSLQDAIERQASLREEMMDPATTDERRDELGREMMESGRTMEDLCRQERENLLLIMSGKLGYTGEKAQEIVDTVNEIYSNTSSRGFGGFGPPPRGRRGGSGR